MAFADNACFVSLPGDVMSGFAPFEDKPKTFQMHDRWSLLFFKFPGVLYLDDDCYSLEPGLIGLIPPGYKRRFEYLGKSHHLFNHFEYDEKAIPPRDYPLMRQTGRQMKFIEEAMLSMIRCQSRNALLAEVTLWQLLLMFDELPVADSGQAGKKAIHPALQSAMEWIELNLSKSIMISDIVAVSETPERSLRRMFNAQLGTTITGYIRERRMEYAYHLLQSTTMRVKQIAFEVGIPDLHLFNKTVKRYWGKPPTMLRKP